MTQDESNGGYPQHARGQVHRYRARGVYDYDFIHDTIDSSRVVHVAFPADPMGDDPFPAVLPMIGCTGVYSPSLGLEQDNPSQGRARDVYIHGYVSSRIMRMSSDANGYVEDGEGLPVTISSTIVDGLVLSLTPNSHSYNYRSAVVYGLANPVKDTDEKLWAMRQITNHVLPGRWEGTRTPPTSTEMTTTQILKVRIIGASGKRRAGQPHDDRHDTANAETVDRVWTGVVPVYEHMGEAVKAEDEKKTGVPAYISQAVIEGNASKQKAAVDAMTEPAKHK